MRRIAAEIGSLLLPLLGSVAVRSWTDGIADENHETLPMWDSAVKSKSETARVTRALTVPRDPQSGASTCVLSSQQGDKDSTPAVMLWALEEGSMPRE